MRLDEVSRKNLVGKTKVQSPERYDKRLRYSTMSIPEIDEDKFLNFDRLVISVKVGNYTDYLTFDGVMEHLIEIVRADPRHSVTRRAVIKALNEQVDRTDVYVRCSCLAPGTEIKLLSGEIMSIEEMLSRYEAGEQLWVYSVDSSGDFKPGRVNSVWVTGQTTELVKVTLDNGESITTTADHLYMCRDGSWCEASSLSVGQSLMPLYFMNNKSATNGYERVKRNSEPLRYDSVYKVVASELLQDEIEEAKIRSGEDSIAIHHRDYNKDNNTPENLEPMGREEHYKYHAHLVSDRWKNDKSFREKAIASSRAVAARINANPTEAMIQSRKSNLAKGWERTRSLTDEQRAKQAAVCRDAITSYWKNMPPEEYKKKCQEISERNNREDIKSKQSIKIKQYWQNMSDEERKLRSDRVRGDANPACSIEVRRGRCFYALDYMSAHGISITEENYYKYKRKTDPRIETLFNNFDELLAAYKQFKYNHKVAKIEKIILDSPVPVYDINVDRYSNFLVNAGVILHNCPDFRYRYAYQAHRHDYLWGPPETRPANMTNPKDNIGAVCKHLVSILSNKKWLVKASSVVNEFIHENYEDILRKYNLTEDEFHFDVAQYRKAATNAAIQSVKQLPPDLLGATNRLYDADKLELQLFELLDHRGWWIAVDSDLDTPNYVRVSKDAKALDGDDASDKVFTFEVIPAGTKVKLKRVESITENY